MMLKSNARPIPWAVAEAVCNKLMRLAPKSVYIVGDPDGRVGEAIECLISDPEVEWNCEYFDAIVDDIPQDTKCLLWVGHGAFDPAQCWVELSELGRQAREVVVCAEPVLRGRGMGLPALKSMDPNLVRLQVDEVPDEHGGIRPREAWEERPQWVIAEIAAWRFSSGAEAERAAFIGRLADLDPRQIGRECERILSTWPNAHEVLTLGMVAAAEQGMRGEAMALYDRLCEQPGISRVHKQWTARLLRAHGVDLVRPTSAREAQGIRRAQQANAPHASNDDVEPL